MPFLHCKRGESHVKVMENNAKINGQRATIFTSTNNRYTGSWSNNRKEGFGRIITKSNRIYEGNWWQNYRHGFGISGRLMEDGVIRYEYRLDWYKGRFSGMAERYYDDGSYYKGYMKNNKRTVDGQMWYTDGSFYEGGWHLDQKHGTGLYVYPNKNRYEGGWQNDVKHGKGRFFHLGSGQMQEGVWTNDICVTSSIVDIPYRQTSEKATLYPIEASKLAKCDQVLQTEVDFICNKKWMDDSSSDKELYPI